LKNWTLFYDYTSSLENKVHSEFVIHLLATKKLQAVFHLSTALLQARKLTYKEKEFIIRFELESKNKI
jgi:hypothetical protein